MQQEERQVYTKTCALCGATFQCTTNRFKYCQNQECVEERYRRNQLAYRLRHNPDYNGAFCTPGAERHRGRPQTYATDEERREAHRRVLRESYRRRKARQRKEADES